MIDHRPGTHSVMRGSCPALQRSWRPTFILEAAGSSMRSGIARKITTGDHWMNGSRGRDPRPQRRPPPAGRTTAMHRQRQNGAGNAHQNYERYLALAREAMSNGDRIEAENFYQHAEHYFRVMRDRTN